MFTTFDKAIVAFITPVALGWLAPFGITGETTVAQAISMLVLGASTAVTVYFTRNK